MAEQTVNNSVPEVVRIIRNPEARSPYSDILASAMKGYLGEIFNQPNPPDNVEELRKRQGLFLFEGSVLRGTATEKTADFDLHILYDGPSDTQIFRPIGFIKSLHPRNETFAVYLSKKLLADPNLKPFYDARAANRQRRMDYIETSNGRPSISQSLDHNLGDAAYLVHIDEDIQSMQTYLDAIRIGDIHTINDPDVIVSRPLVSILTTTPDMVFETTSGVLIHHQGQIVEALTHLQQTTPDRFDQFYKVLQQDFDNMHRSTAWRYPGRDFRQLGEYYLKSGRFQPQYLTPQQLIDLTARRMTYPQIKSYFESLSSFDDYKNNMPGILKRMTSRFGIEENLDLDKLEKIAKGENILQEEEEKLSPEALEEVRIFERRIKRIYSIRNQIKLPDLQVFQDAYLSDI